MAQFDVCRNRNPRTRRSIPFLLDVQSDLLSGLVTRVVVPLVRASEMRKPAAHLNPQFTIQGAKVVMSTVELAGVPVEVLGDKVGSLKSRRDDIIGALDFLFTGF
ncbi:MAG: CcdB family protein [Pseudomonadota bacterium]